METNNNDYWENKRKKVLNKEELFKAILENINTNPKYEPFFAQYHPDSVARFKENYARYKTSCLENEDYFRKEAERKLLKYNDIAEICLWEIQHYKLLQLEGLWRNGQIELAGVRYTHDFMYWHSHIEECSFIDPITSDEVERYITYLIQEESDNIYEINYNGVFPYDDIRNRLLDEDSDRELIPYVEYMINLFGKTNFLLEDVRKAEEERYLEAYKPATTEVEEAKAEEDQKVAIDTKPYASFNTYNVDNQFIEVVEKFGTPDMIAYKNANWELMSIYGGWPYFDDSVEILEEVGENYPVEYHHNWQWAIILAAEKYKKEPVVQAIRLAYKSYLERLECGIGFHVNESVYRLSDVIYKIFSEQAEKIELGKKILGES